MIGAVPGLRWIDAQRLQSCGSAESGAGMAARGEGPDSGSVSGGASGAWAMQLSTYHMVLRSGGRRATHRHR
eukprot:760477-Hanusia_phi.AAC.2